MIFSSINSHIRIRKIGSSFVEVIDVIIFTEHKCFFEIVIALLVFTKNRKKQTVVYIINESSLALRLVFVRLKIFECFLKIAPFKLRVEIIVLLIVSSAGRKK